jgi:hypothetical protein
MITNVDILGNTERTALRIRAHTHIYAKTINLKGCSKHGRYHQEVNLYKVAAISQLTGQQQQLPPPASPALANNSLVQLSTRKLCELPANQTCLSTQKILLANITKDYFGNWILFGEVQNNSSVSDPHNNGSLCFQRKQRWY